MDMVISAMVIGVIVFIMVVSLVRYIIYYEDNKEEKEVNKVLDFLIDGNFTWEKQKYENSENIFTSEEKFVLRIDCGGVYCCFVLGKVWGIEVFREDGVGPRRSLIKLKIESSFYNGTVDNSDYSKIDTLYEKVAGCEIYEEVKGKDAVEKLSLLNNYLKEHS